MFARCGTAFSLKKLSGLVYGKNGTDARNYAYTPTAFRAVFRAETSMLLIRIFCGKGERALSVQSGNVEHHAEVRAVSCAEKMAQMQKSLQEAIQLSVQRQG